MTKNYKNCFHSLDYYRAYRANLKTQEDVNELAQNIRIREFQNRQKDIEKFRELDVIKQIKERIEICMLSFYYYFERNLHLIFSFQVALCQFMALKQSHH